MATTLSFVRHGKTSMNKHKLWSGRTDCDLKEEGRAELLEMFNFTEEDFDVYYCSPLKRTKQTLDCIVQNQSPIIDKRIIERDFGDWEGKPYAIIDSETTELYIQGKVQPPNGETYKEVEKRVISFVTDLFRQYSNCRILIVSHATVLRMVRDIFLPTMEKKPIKNSQMLVVTQDDFEGFLSRSNWFYLKKHNHNWLCFFLYSYKKLKLHRKIFALCSTFL